MTPQALLARIRLNPQNRDVQRDLTDATEMHRTVMRLLPDGLGDSPRNRGGLLYRVEETSYGSMLLVQARQIDATALPDRYGHTEVKDLAPMFQALREGLAVKYRIVANPSKQGRLPAVQKGKRGPVVPLVGPEADAWWQRKAEAAGLRLQIVTPTDQGCARGRSAPGMKHRLIRYDGIAVVTDAQTLREAVLTGIGRGKAYGAGLLSLAPAGTP